jgi:hypothetical protein
MMMDNAILHEARATHWNSILTLAMQAAILERS